MVYYNSRKSDRGSQRNINCRVDVRSCIFQLSTDCVHRWSGVRELRGLAWCSLTLACRLCVTKQTSSSTGDLPHKQSIVHRLVYLSSQGRFGIKRLLHASDLWPLHWWTDLFSLTSFPWTHTITHWSCTCFSYFSVLRWRSTHLILSYLPTETD